MDITCVRNKNKKKIEIEVLNYLLVNLLAIFRRPPHPSSYTWRKCIVRFIIYKAPTYTGYPLTLG
jgi:hypothetical protein